MQTKKMSLATIQGKLSRSEMKHIQGGIDPINDGCKGIIECPTLDDGDSCGSIENGKCKCSHRPNGDKLCL